MYVLEKMYYYIKIKRWLLKKFKFFKIFYGIVFVLILLFVNIEYFLMYGKWDNGIKKVNDRRGCLVIDIIFFGYYKFLKFYIGWIEFI